MVLSVFYVSDAPGFPVAFHINDVCFLFSQFLKVFAVFCFLE